MADLTRVPGKTTTCTDKEHTLGATVVNTKESTTWTRSTGMVSTSGQMAVVMKDTGRTASNMEKENTFCRRES